jgi:hypothetical protein
MDRRLSLEQHLELLLGPTGGQSAFDSDESRCAAWREHSAELIRMVDPGSRPWGWWQYQASAPSLPRESQLAYLVRCGLLTDVEQTRLENAGIQLTSRSTRNP